MAEQIIFRNEALSEVNWEWGSPIQATDFKQLNDVDLVTGETFSGYPVDATITSDGLAMTDGSTGELVLGAHPASKALDGYMVLHFLPTTLSSGGVTTILTLTPATSGKTFAVQFNRNNDTYTFSWRNGGSSVKAYAPANPLITSDELLRVPTTLVLEWWVNESGQKEIYIHSKDGYGFVADTAGSGALLPDTLNLSLADEGITWGLVASFEGRLTQERAESLVANPYQLFKRQETVQQEYCLTFDASDQALEIDNVTSTSEYTVEFELGDSIPSVPSDALHFFYANGGVFYKVNSGEYTGNAARPTDIYINDVFAVTLGSTAVTVAALDSAVAGDTIKAVVTHTTDSIAYFVNTSSLNRGAYGLSVKNLKVTDDNGSRFWEFNQTTGSYVKDHYNGAIATLVGFPADSGYVRAWGVSDGLDCGVGESVTLPSAVMYSDDFNITLDYREYYTSTALKYIFDFLAINKSSGELRLYVDGVTTIISTPTTRNSDRHILNVKRVSGSITVTLDGSLLSTTTSTADITLSYIGSSLIECTLYSLSIIASGDDRYYDFTAIRGNSLVVPETINGQDGTMVGFPSNGVYVPERNKVLVGQELTTSADQVLFTLTGVWTSTLTLIDGTTSTPSGTGNYTLDGTVLTQVATFEITDTVSTYNYDFTQEAGDTILDTSGNDNHGSVVGGSLRRIYDYTGYGEIVGYKGGSDAVHAYVSKFNRQKFTFKAKVFVPSDLTERSVLFGTDSNTQNTMLGIGITPLGAVEAISKNAITNAGNYSFYFNTSTDLCNLDDWNDIEVEINPTTLTPTSVIVNNGTPKVMNFGTTQDWHSTAGWATLYGFMLFAARRAGAYVYSSNPVLMQNAELYLHSDDVTYSWDCTTGDATKIIDTVGNNHATITNGSTTKWQPIVPVDVYTNGDYATLSSFNSAQNSDTTNQKEYRAGSTVGGTLTGFPKGLTLNGGDITTALTVSTSGLTQIVELTATDIDASSATGDVYLLNVEADNVTG